MGSLAEASLQSRVLAIDKVSHRDWPPGTRWGNGPQWPLARKQKRQRCKALKITVCYSQDKKKNLWVNIAVCFHFPLSSSLPHTYTSYDPFREIKCDSYIFVIKCYDSSCYTISCFCIMIFYCLNLNIAKTKMFKLMSTHSKSIDLLCI